MEHHNEARAFLNTPAMGAVKSLRNLHGDKVYSDEGDAKSEDCPDDQQAKPRLGRPVALIVLWLFVAIPTSPHVPRIGVNLQCYTLSMEVRQVRMAGQYSGSESASTRVRGIA